MEKNWTHQNTIFCILCQYIAVFFYQKTPVMGFFGGISKGDGFEKRRVFYGGNLLAA